MPDLIIAALWVLSGRLIAFFMPAYCLRSLEKWPLFHRALRQSVGKPEAICCLNNGVQCQPDGTRTVDLPSLYSDFRCRSGQPLLNDKCQEQQKSPVPSGSTLIPALALPGQTSRILCRPAMQATLNSRPRTSGNLLLSPILSDVGRHGGWIFTADLIH